MPTRFYEQDVRSRLSRKRAVSAFLDAIIARHRPEVGKASLTYIFCSDEALLQMNQQFLDHDTFTDIITFDLSEQPDELTGEIYISVDRITENALKFQVPYQQELHRVIFHGALHLCGFKDKTKREAATMREQENQCLEAWAHHKP